MNDTLIALGAASAALTPFAWVLRQRWVCIRPLRGSDVHWRLDAPQATALLTRRYAVHGEWLAAEWRSQFQAQGAAWLLRATAIQIEQLQDAGWGEQFTADGTCLVRNQAMDLLMLAKSPETEDCELLEFFKVYVEEPNALVVSFQASVFRRDAQAMQKWNERPATALQKEALRYFQGKVGRNVTAESAKATLLSIERGLYQSGQVNNWNTWLRFSETWKQLQAKDVCMHYDIKKPAPTKIREAIQSLLDENVAEWTDKDVVVQRLVELYPDLELRKASSLA